MSSATPPTVSAILVARNEEGNIVAAIESVLEALRCAHQAGGVGAYEVTLVDSASTDRTVEIALRYPITVVRLRPGWPLSAAAGRATGARLAAGELLLFVDGDYVLNADWLLAALRVLNEERVGAVCGIDLERPTGTTVLARRWQQMIRELAPVTAEVDSIATGLVRRDAYASVGGIHPFLRGAEDRDLGQRLVLAGWRIVQTKEPMGLHNFASGQRPATYVDYYRSVTFWSLGAGQACRARWQSQEIRRGFLRRYVNARFFIQDLELLAWIVLVLANLLGALQGGWFLAVALLADVASLGSLELWRSRHSWTWREVLYERQGAVYGPLRQVLFTVGLLRRSPPPEAYPTDVEFVQRSGALPVPPT